MDNVSKANGVTAVVDDTKEETTPNKMELFVVEDGKGGNKYTVDGGKEDEDKDDQIYGSRFSQCVELVETRVHTFVSRHSGHIRLGMYLSLLVAYVVYFSYCMWHRFGDEGSIILLFITCCFFWKLFFVSLDKRRVSIELPQSFHDFVDTRAGRRYRRGIRYFLYISAMSALILYLGFVIFAEDIRNLQAFVGMLLLIFLCFITSYKPSKVNWHPVFWSFIIQFIVATITLRTQFGYDAIKWLGDQVANLFAFSDAGSIFVIDNDFKTMGLAFSSSGILIFTNALVFLLNHWGAIEFVVLKLGWFLSFCLETGPVESVVAVASVFLGLSEAPLLVRPYLRTVTVSELHTIMTCGFASISGGFMGLFIQFGAPSNHLLTAAVISAPAALAMSKLMYPETERIALESQTNITMTDKSGRKESNSLNAFSEGAVMAVTIAAATWSNMLAFVSILDLLNFIVRWLGERAGIEGLSINLVCSYLLFPIAFAMGVDFKDCEKIGSLIGIKLFATPVVGYTNLGYLIENREMFESYVSIPNNTWHWDGGDIFLEATNVTLVNGIISERSEVIGTYAMCGFSAFTSIGICLGSLIPMCPVRKNDIVRVVLRAFMAGNMASFITGAIAGVMFVEGP